MLPLQWLRVHCSAMVSNYNNWVPKRAIKTLSIPLLLERGLIISFREERHFISHAPLFHLNEFSLHIISYRWKQFYQVALLANLACILEGENLSRIWNLCSKSRRNKNRLSQVLNFPLEGFFDEYNLFSLSQFESVALPISFSLGWVRKSVKFLLNLLRIFLSLYFVVGRKAPEVFIHLLSLSPPVSREKHFIKFIRKWGVKSEEGRKFGIKPRKRNVQKIRSCLVQLGLCNTNIVPLHLSRPAGLPQTHRTFLLIKWGKK